MSTAIEMRHLHKNIGMVHGFLNSAYLRIKRLCPLHLRTCYFFGGTSQQVTAIDFQVTLAAIWEFLLLLFQLCLSILKSVYQFIVQTKKSVESDIVLITGAAHGIGRELARQYGLLGAQVICVDINSQLNDETVTFLQNKGIIAYGYQCDVSKRQEVLELARKIRQQIGDVTILINNAGIGPSKRLLSHTEQEIRQLFDVNIISHFWTLEAFLPAMMNANYGHIIAISSLLGIAALPNVVPYSSTKFGVRGLMDGLHEEFRSEGRNIKLTTICPHMVDTGLIKKPQIRFNILLGMLEPEKVAAAIINAQRRGLREISLPRYMRPSVLSLRLLPDKAKEAIFDFSRTGIGAFES